MSIALCRPLGLPTKAACAGLPIIELAAAMVAAAANIRNDFHN